MSYKLLIYILSSLLIILVFTVGLVIIYTEFVYSPTGHFYSFMVYPPSEQIYESEFPSANQQEINELKATVISIIREQKATLIYKHIDRPGAGILACSDWLKNTTGLKADELDIGDVYMSDNPSLREACLDGSKFLVGNVAFHIKGYYATEKAPPGIRGEDFLFHYRAVADISGYYLTDANDMDELMAAFKTSGYKLSMVGEKSSAGALNVLRRMIHNGYMSRSLLYGILALLFSYFYISLSFVKDRLRGLWIHHVFGLSRTRLFLRILFLSGINPVCAGLLLFFLIRWNYSYLPYTDIRCLSEFCLISVTLVSIAAVLMQYKCVNRAFLARGDVG